MRPVDRPHALAIRVALNRVRRCPKEIGDSFWPRNGRPRVKAGQEESIDSVLEPTDEPCQEIEIEDQDTESEIMNEEVDDPVPKEPDPLVPKSNSQSLWRGHLCARPGQHGEDSK